MSSQQWFDWCDARFPETPSGVRRACHSGSERHFTKAAQHWLNMRGAERDGVLAALVAWTAHPGLGPPMWLLQELKKCTNRLLNDHPAAAAVHALRQHWFQPNGETHPAIPDWSHAWLQVLNGHLVPGAQHKTLTHLLNL